MQNIIPRAATRPTTAIIQIGTEKEKRTLGITTLNPYHIYHTIFFVAIPHNPNQLYKIQN
jgi:hypothetical protein